MQLLLDAIGRGFDGGTLEFVAGDDIWMLGHGEPRARVQLRDPGVLREILLRPRLEFGETYMEHGREPADGDPLRVLAVEIGRAPCRERGCPNVELQVVDVAITKKRYKHHLDDHC